MATKSKPKSKAKAKAASAGSPDVRVRMYRVGFGDFFLLTLNPDDDPQHILIDCGVTPGKTKKGDIGTIKAAARQMAKDTGGKLALIIVTHRHQDHIIGFSRCADTFAAFENKVGAIWMSAWEAEYDQNATAFQAELTALAADMQMHFALGAGEDPEAAELQAMLLNATGEDAGGAEPEKEGKGGGTNKKSLEMLKTGFGVTPDYYKHGDKPKLPKALEQAGLEAEILGPPPIDALDFMKLMDLKKGVGQYLGADGKGSNGGGKTFDPFGPAWHAEAKDYPSTAFREWEPRLKDVPAAMPPSDKLQATVNAAQPKLLLTAVKSLDAFLNNQSLVVLFTFKGKKLLFAGDAQGGNWEYWMFGGTPTKTPSIDDLSADGKKILGHLDFYKVGHHGSTNATPVTAVDAMGGTFVSMCSTQDDSFGSVENASEVPRIPLLEALVKKSPVVRSDQFPVTVKGAEVEAIAGSPAKPPKGFKVGPIYVDYFL
jgi:glyoxylase-like metal-dependent hydrolase (beta-lactamase superfamily II)